MRLKKSNREEGYTLYEQDLNTCSFHYKEKCFEIPSPINSMIDQTLFLPYQDNITGFKFAQIKTTSNSGYYVDLSIQHTKILSTHITRFITKING